MTPAFAYGRVLGSVVEAYREMFRQIAAGMESVKKQPLTEEQKEALSNLRYQRMIDRERQKGLDYVDRLARKLERDLGLR